VGINEYIDGVISAKDVKRGKPFPDVYLYACEITKTNPNDVVVFEDSPNGLMSSSAAGCFTVMVEDLTPFEKDMNYVDSAVSSLIELL
jgi:DNA helicase-2/ATP-dependent DNA helicase PcrA